MTSSNRGLIWCYGFVLLDAVQAVYSGGILQRIDGFLLCLAVFGVAANGCLLWAWTRTPEHIAIAARSRADLIGINVAAAGGWVTYLGAIQLIEPAAAFAILCGAVPLATIVAARFGVEEADTARNSLEALGQVILAAGVAFLAVATVLGWSGFVRGGATVAVAGVAMSVACGALMAAMLLYGSRLDKLGVGPVAQFGLRFPLFLVVALAAFLAGVDDKGPVPAGDMLIAIAAGLVLLAFPVYAVQKAVSLSTTLTIGTAAAVTPLVVFLLQMVEGRVAYSRATLAGLAIYFAGAMLAAMGSVRALASEERRPA